MEMLLIKNGVDCKVYQGSLIVGEKSYFVLGTIDDQYSIDIQVNVVTLGRIITVFDKDIINKVKTRFVEYLEKNQPARPAKLKQVL